jgi:hypothetical protein
MLGRPSFAEPAKTALALVGGTVYPGPNDEPILDGAIVIDRGKIVAVGPRDKIMIAADIKTLDCTVQADETSMKMPRPNKRGFVWTFLADDLIAYRFADNRSGETPLQVHIGGSWPPCAKRRQGLFWKLDGD